MEVEKDYFKIFYTSISITLQANHHISQVAAVALLKILSFLQSAV